MADQDKLAGAERGGFDVRIFLIAVVVIGVLVGVALWILLAYEGGRLLPQPPDSEPHSRLLAPALPEQELS